MTYRPKYLSVSSVALYAECPAQYRARYVERMVKPSTPGQLWGKAFHAALEAEHRGENSERTWIAAWNDADELSAVLDDRAFYPGKAHGLALLDAYRARGLGGKRGMAEVKFVLPLPRNVIPVPILGYIDLTVPDERHFREFKTSGSKTGKWAWTEVKIALQHQLHVYGWAYQRLYRHRPKHALYCVFGTKEPTLDVYEAQPSPDGLRLFEQAAEMTWQGIIENRYEGCGTCDLCKPKDEKTPGGLSLEWE